MQQTPNPALASILSRISETSCQDLNTQRVKHTMVRRMVQSGIGFSSKLVAQRRATNSAERMSRQR